jgi:hypothetical protein
MEILWNDLYFNGYGFELDLNINYTSDIGITKSIFKIPVDIFPGTRIDALVSFFISYLLPFLLLNYFLIFYKDKYKELIKLYPSYDGKLFLKYFLGSLGAIVLYFSIAIFVVKIL